MAATRFVPPANQPAPEAEAESEVELDEAATGEPPANAVVETGVACQCGHIEGAHEHYRRGTDCALCGCARFRRADHLRRRPRTD